VSTTTSSLSYAVWALIGAGGLALWWLSFRRPPRLARPVEVVGRMATHAVIRVVLVLTFMWFGWHLFAR
jgi:hypothetical protein